MAAQNQHYVPKFILRNFSSPNREEYVWVYDKHTDRVFETPMRNILAERRFHDFTIGDDNFSFEPIIGKIEDFVLPHYASVVKNGFLTRSSEEIEALSFLIAFQMLRAKAHRDSFIQLDAAVRAKFERAGDTMENIDGWSSLTEDRLKALHMGSLIKGIEEFSYLISMKRFFIIEAETNSKFYLGDNPVFMDNKNDYGPYGNLGLSVRGIQIYMPLSSNLMIAAYCPTIIEEFKTELDKFEQLTRSLALSNVMRGIFSTAQCKSYIETHILNAPAKNLIDAIEGMIPLKSSADNMEYYNAHQAMQASRFLICKNANFKLAKEVNKERPEYRNGRKWKIN